MLTSSLPKSNLCFVSKPTNCMSASVSVPVLSVIIRVVEPKVSAADSFLTTPFFFAILSAPIASITVRVIGSASGTAPTATAAESTSIGSNGSPRDIPRMKMPITIVITTQNMSQAKCPIPF